MSIDLFDTASLLSEEELMVKENVSRFVRENVKPIIQEHFEQHRFPSDLIQPIAELGLLGSSIEGYECAGMNATSYGLICQELERGDSGIRSFVSVQSSLVMYPIYTYGSDEQKEKWLPRLAKAESIGCFGLTESHGGSDPSNMKTHAKKDGDDWIINGSKMWITNGSIADVALIWAMTDEGIRGFIVETSSKGFVANKIENKFSLRASITSELFLDNVRVSNDSVLPNVIGLKGPLSCLTQARYGISWGVIGAAEDCLEQLLEYTDSRILFDRALSENQSIQIRLADMQRKIVMASLLSIRLGQLKDKNQMNPTQVSLAKWNNVRMALDIARDCRDMLGGSGISAEYVPIRHMLNLESVITYEGTETIHQLTVGRNLTGKNAF
ncbi:MAG: acyl-CoA dehydrogenase [Gammaproteobacteria bacterium]|jgi:glutaryl-CoA dehydrogenase|nr:acyl-CoA dehydrogenase [Gammaproteobacteria bacterium]|tara:strand:- start:2933 stop:4084 length:1152 start_codon:yes stop_codon:yes gene_type:complete